MGRAGGAGGGGSVEGVRLPFFMLSEVLKRLSKKYLSNPVVRQGVPFLILMLVSPYLLSELASFRYEFGHRLSNKGKLVVDEEKELELVQKNLPKDYTMIRVSRPWEEATEEKKPEQ